MLLSILSRMGYSLSVTPNLKSSLKFSKSKTISYTLLLVYLQFIPPALAPLIPATLEGLTPPSTSFFCI